MSSMPRVISYSYALAFLLTLILSLLQRSTQPITVYGSMIIVTWLILALTRSMSPKIQYETKLRIATLNYALIFICLTSISFSEEAFPNLLESNRLQLFYANPNMLGAVLSTFAIATLILSKNRFVPVSIAFTFLAIVLTGSRTALLALTGGFIIWALISHIRWTLTYSVAFALFMGGFNMLTRQHINHIDTMLDSHNLLKVSNDFLDDAWVEWRYNDQLSIDENATEGPFENTRASRLRATSGSSHPLVIYQDIEPNNSRAIDNTPYTGSIYIKASTPQRIVLSTQLSKVICNVENEWQRCTTPAGYGNQSIAVQLRLETEGLKQSFDIYVWGAQVEIGIEASPYVEKYHPPSSYLSAKRLDLRRLTEDTSATSRMTAIKAAWGMFTSNPLIGIGLKAYPNTYAQSSFQEVFPDLTGAHNIVFSYLASSGIIGLLILLLVLISPLVYSWKSHWKQLCPLVATILILNTFDYSFLNLSTGFIVYWFALGLIIFSSNVKPAP